MSADMSVFLLVGSLACCFALTPLLGLACLALIASTMHFLNIVSSRRFVAHWYLLLLLLLLCVLTRSIYLLGRLHVYSMLVLHESITRSNVYYCAESERRLEAGLFFNDYDLGQ
jgi:hypothetical protein